jgi:hypothetical protein
MLYEVGLLFVLLKGFLRLLRISLISLKIPCKIPYNYPEKLEKTLASYRISPHGN